MPNENTEQQIISLDSIKEEISAANTDQERQTIITQILADLSEGVRNDLWIQCVEEYNSAPLVSLVILEQLALYVDVNLQDYDGYTALYCAFGQRNPELIKFLCLKHDADVSLKNICGEVFFFTAYDLSFIETLLEHNTDTDQLDFEGEAAQKQQIMISKILEAASIQRDGMQYLWDWCLRRLEECGSQYKRVNITLLRRLAPHVDVELEALRKALRKAFALRWPELIKLFLKHLKPGVNVNQEDKYGYTLLHYACETPDLISFIRALLRHGADINQTGFSGRTPLHLACIAKNEAAVRLLLICGAEVNQPDKQGNSPLHVASWLGIPEIVKILLRYGAQREQLSNDGESALYVACYSYYRQLHHGDGCLTSIIVPWGELDRRQPEEPLKTMELLLKAEDNDVFRTSLIHHKQAREIEHRQLPAVRQHQSLPAPALSQTLSQASMVPRYPPAAVLRQEIEMTARLFNTSVLPTS